MVVTEAKQTKINELLEGGEWACSYGQCGTLTHVCLQLADVVEDKALAAMARHIARELDEDPGVASLHWMELCDELRQRRIRESQLI